MRRYRDIPGRNAALARASFRWSIGVPIVAVTVFAPAALISRSTLRWQWRIFWTIITLTLIVNTLIQLRVSRRFQERARAFRGCIY